MTYPRPAPASTLTPVDPPPPAGDEADSAGAAAQQAHELKDTTTHAAADVADTAKEQAATVVSEVRQQANDLLHQAQREVTSQAASQQQRAASGLRALGEELRGMADRGEGAGPATSLSRQAAERATTLADWLENREPGDVLNEVTRFARQRPAAFLALAAGAGLLTGRLVRGLTGTPRGGSGGQSGTLQATPVARPLPDPVDPTLAAPQALHIDAGVVPAASGDLPGGIGADQGRAKA